VRRLLPLLVVVLVTAACGGTSASPSEVAMKDLDLIVHNRYDEAWDGMYSRDRAVAKRSEYVSCESRSPVQEAPQTTKPVGVSDESVGIGDGTFVKSKAVRLQLDFRGGRLVHTVHLIKEKGGWRWILPSWRYRDYKADRCPTDVGSSPPPTQS
jgi:hypothetical protein